MNIGGKNNNGKYDFVNSRALFVLKVITMSFAILAFVVVSTAMMTKWITDLNRAVKESRTKIAKATARLDKYRKSRIKHILKQRRLQLKEEKAEKSEKDNSKKNDTNSEENESTDIYDDDMDDMTDITEDEIAINKFDNELKDIILDEIDEEL